MKKILAAIVSVIFSHPSVAQTDNVQKKPEGFVLPNPSSEYDQKLLQDLTKIGWHHVHIQGDETGPAYAFSLGFYANYNHPEIIVFGLKPETAQQLLNIAAIGIVGNKSKFENYKAYNDIAEGTRIAFIPVSQKYLHEYLGYGEWLYQSKKGVFPVLQMVWPDKQGLLPWEKGYDTSFLKVQPLLDK